MAQRDWEADKTLEVYIYDYLFKRNLHASAKAFMEEAKVSTDPVAINSSEGFLFEWWSTFWDIFISRRYAKHSQFAAPYNEAQRMKAREERKLNMQLRQFQRGNPSHSHQGASVTNIHPNGIMDLSSSLLAMKMVEVMKSDQAMNLGTSDGNRMAFHRPTYEHQGQSHHGNLGNMSALQQIPSRAHPAREVKSEAMNAAQNSIPLDLAIYGHTTLQSKPGGSSSAGLNQGDTCLPLKGWPSTPSLGLQKPNMQTQSQFLLASQQQQALAHVHTQESLGNSNQFADMDPRRFGGLPRSGLPVNGQFAKNEGPIRSHRQANSTKMKMGQMQQSSSQPQDQLVQQQVTKPKTRKRKQQSSSGPANSNGTGNTAGYSPSPEGNGALPSTSNMLDDLDQFVALSSLDVNVDSFIISDGGDNNNFYGTLNQKEGSIGSEFPFGEVGSIRTGNNKVTCCHFSSDGKFLASSGHDKKIVYWNMDNLQTETTPEVHNSVITDIRFRPNSTQLATTSIDQSVKVWDAANPSCSLRAYTGHTSAITSLDFNPVKTDLICISDNDDEIHYLDFSTFNCFHSFKGGGAHVRFQPIAGKLLAAAADKVVSIFDVETKRKLYSFEGHHNDMVNYICWDPVGEYLATVTPNLVKVWCMVSGQCIQEHFSTNVNQFHSCVFHAGSLVIGGLSCFEIWNIGENKSMLIPAHEDIISSLSYSSSNLVASASHDSAVKIWK